LQNLLQIAEVYLQAGRQNTITHVLLLAVVTLLVSRCGSAPEAGSTVKTDLGYYGNLQVDAKFKAYKQKPTLGCKAATTTSKRVIVTGFGLFSGVNYNISGVVVSSMADQTLTPSILSTNNFVESLNTLAGGASSGTINTVDSGARTVNRTMKLDGVSYDICFITMDVIWDLAAAIITYEMEAFKPHMVMMTGRGGASGIFEGGARNYATASSGFESNGFSAPTNTPNQSYILAAKALSSETPMTWDSKQLLAASKGLIDEIGLPMTYAQASRPSNNYICNNVSYVVLEAAKGTAIRLAGGRIKLYPTAAPSRVVGFMHFPDQADNSPTSVGNWVKVLATTIRTALP